MAETESLLSHIDDQHRTADQSLVDFDSNGDPDNPMDWPKAYKLGIVTLLAFMAFTV